MPKLKVHSGAKKRFSFTATGRVISTRQGKRHGMTKRTNKFRRDRNVTVLEEPAASVVRKYFPYAV